MHLTPAVLADAEVLWSYHDLGHDLRPCDVAVGLGSHDRGVASRAAEVFKLGLAPLIVFTGANAPTTVEPFPRGEAVHYAEIAGALGVPTEAILVEPRARNTSENFAMTRDLLAGHGRHPASLLVISRPYQQRRAFATCRAVWPDVDVLCTCEQTTLDAYLARIGNAPFVLDMLVGDTQRVMEYPGKGFAVEQPVPVEVIRAFDRLVAAGYTARLLAP
jgi:uncharacterized SAM-binding protein YcdF (DUF218 family)